MVTKREAEHALRKRGFSRAEAKRILDRGFDGEPAEINEAAAADLITALGGDASAPRFEPALPSRDAAGYYYR